MRQPEPFWRGAIRSRRHAKKIVHRVAWTFSIWAAMFAPALMRRFEMHNVLALAMFVAPAIALLWIQDAVLAGILVALCGLYTACSALLIVYAATTGDSRGGLYTLAFLFWLVLTLAGRRAFIAARYLKLNRGQDQA